MGAHASATTTPKPASKPASKKTAAKPANSKKVTASKSRKKVTSRKLTSRKLTSRKHSRRARRGAWKRRGQQAIDQQRIRQIQEALVREKYLNGQPTGTWDDGSRQAMMKYQQDNGWQTRVIPDSRALIKLGLGPSYAGVINPESLPASKNAAPVTLPAAGVVTQPQP
jgi:hypothetical protein